MSAFIYINACGAIIIILILSCWLKQQSGRVTCARKLFPIVIFIPSCCSTTSQGHQSISRATYSKCVLFLSNERPNYWPCYMTLPTRFYKSRKKPSAVCLHKHYRGDLHSQLSSSSSYYSSFSYCKHCMNLLALLKMFPSRKQTTFSPHHQLWTFHTWRLRTERNIISGN